MWLEGVAVKFSGYGVHGLRRAVVKCPLHEKCQAQRSFPKKFAKGSGQGDQEPFCFLGVCVWLRSAGRFSSGSAHEEFRKCITHEDTRAYVLRLAIIMDSATPE